MVKLSKASRVGWLHGTIRKPIFENMTLKSTSKVGKTLWKNGKVKASNTSRLG